MAGGQTTQVMALKHAIPLAILKTARELTRVTLPRSDS
jgi:hypothetical protein